MNKEELANRFDLWCSENGILDDDMPDAVGRFSEQMELTEEETEALESVR